VYIDKMKALLATKRSPVCFGQPNVPECAWAFHFLLIFMQQKFNCPCVVVFFLRLACTGWNYEKTGIFLQAVSKR